MKQYDTFILKEEINPVLKKGMQGVILEIFNSEFIEAEFVKPDGTNWEFENSFTFSLPISKIDAELQNE